LTFILNYANIVKGVGSSNFGLSLNQQQIISGELEREQNENEKLEDCRDCSDFLWRNNLTRRGGL
jgi:hypothetical protein